MMFYCVSHLEVDNVIGLQIILNKQLLMGEGLLTFCRSSISLEHLGI